MRHWVGLGATRNFLESVPEVAAKLKEAHTKAASRERELLLSYFDFLPAAFLAHGRRLRLYVDYHSLFFTHDPAALTQLGWALKFYDISFQYAPTPQAKGKIERAHQYWQGRLPAYFASEKITEIAAANPEIAALRAHHNAQEIHRELRQTPQRAWNQAKKDNRSVLRPTPVACGGIMCGVCALSSRSAAMGASPSARNACASENLPRPK